MYAVRPVDPAAGAGRAYGPELLRRAEPELCRRVMGPGPDEEDIALVGFQVLVCWNPSQLLTSFTRAVLS